MIFSSLCLNSTREASFFSRKTAQIIKDILDPPRKVGNAYTLFYMQNYPEYKGTGLKLTEISKDVATKWNSLTEKQKSVFTSKANEIKSKYDDENGKFNDSLTVHQKLALNLLTMNRRILDVKTAKRDLNSEQKNFLKGMPQPAALTPRGVFISQRLKGVPASQTGLGEAMIAWSNLSPVEKESFVKIAQENLKAYIASMVDFLGKK